MTFKQLKKILDVPLLAWRNDGDFFNIQIWTTVGNTTLLKMEPLIAQ
jgi:hypothetical protein